MNGIVTMVEGTEGFMSWFNTTTIGGFVLGGVAVAVSFMRRTFSRNSLDVAQFDSIKQTLELMRAELARERSARITDLHAWRAREETLQAELEKVTAALATTRMELAATVQQLMSTNDKLISLQRDFEQMVRSTPH